MQSKFFNFILLTVLISPILVLSSIFKTAICVSKTARDLTYPEARRNESVIDDFFGTQVADPYRWLEDPDSAETKQFIDAQNEVTEPFLKNCGQWQNINNKLTSLWNYPKYSAPERHGKYYFSYKNTGLQNQNVWYKQESLTSEPTVFLDLNTLSPDGTIALQTESFSEDGKLLAYGLSESGSDWMKIKIRDVETGEDFPEILERIKYSLMSWTHDNKGFFYSQYPDAHGEMDGALLSENHKLYYHRVGQPQSEDVLIVDIPENPSWRLYGEVSHCGKFLFLHLFKGLDENKVYFANLENYRNISGKISFTPIAKKFGAYYSYVTNIDSKCLFFTNKDAQNYRLISIDLNRPEEANWETLVPENEKDVLDMVYLVDYDKLVLHYTRDVKSVLQVHSLATGQFIRNFPLEMGQVISISGNRKYSEMFYELESFLTPSTVYQYNFSRPEVEPSILNESKLNLQGFDQNNFIIDQVFYPSKDGTMIPMFIVQKKGDKKGPKPCLMYGYGGLGVSVLPSFDIASFFFVDAFDGILAIPNIRGGGEYKGWHNAGRLLNKQNVFDDFQAAAEYLIRNNFTETKKLAIQGASNGGILIGACINQRPDLFGAAIAHVGVMDMLRFPKFTIGQAWISEFGNPENKTEFENLYKYSPLHNVRSPNSTERQYPSTLILTADHDDSVSPLHSLKFTAALHHAIKDNQYQKNPILLRVYKNAGHGAGKPTSKLIEEATDILLFLYRVLPINATV